MPLQVFFFAFPWPRSSMDGYVIHINGYTPLVNEIVEDGVHHRLECGQGVGESKEHDRWFVQAFVGYECCLPLVFFFDKNLVVSPLNIESSKQSAVT